MGIMMKSARRNALIGIALIALVFGGGYLWYAKSYSHPLPLAEGDTIESWEWKGTYKDGAELETRATSEIARLETLFGNPENDPTDYSIYVSLANQYELLGDGRSAYEQLGRAAAIDSEKTGLAWHNLGSLMEKLGALRTARIAFSNAVKAQPHIEQYQIAYLRFLTKHVSDDNAVVEAVFNGAEEQFENPAAVLQLRAEWYAQKGEIQKAISALERVQSLMPSRDQGIDARIAEMRRTL